jgi:ATP synthase protein I
MTKAKNKLFEQLLRYSTIGLEMGISVAIGIVLGYFLDRYLGTTPWLTLIFMLLGVAAAFRSLFALMKTINKNKGPHE